MLHIAHVTATFPPYRGGTGNVCYYNARELARRGHQVEVFTAAVMNFPEEEETEGVRIHRLNPVFRMGNAPVIPKLFSMLRGFDLIHLHYPFLGGELAAVAARITRIPLVITYHQDVLLSGLIAWVESLLRHTIGRFALRSASRILFTSRDYGQASYIRPLLRGREKRIGEMLNGVDTDFFFPGEPPNSLYAACGLAFGDRIALLVAGLDRAHYFKGINIFLNALTLLPEKNKAIIVGDGELRSSYEATAHSLGLARRVFFAGRVSDEALPDYYRLADVTVLPSVTMGEAFGLVLLESMACNTPVIASSLPGVRTVVEDGRDGFLVPPGDADMLAKNLRRLLDDPLLRQEMGRRGRLKVEVKYAWPVVVDQLERVYASILTISDPNPKSDLETYGR
jgi:glycosyltransferase involved in cell wall biosynthesis